MKTPNRDLLVLMKDECLDEDAMQHELEQLNTLLLYFETVDNICVSHEVFDMNRYKIVTKPQLVQKIIDQKETKPFVFICNKN
jgi:hypothetical protein